MYASASTWPARRASTDQDLLSAAARVAADGGPAAATIGAIAKRPAPPPARCYHRFPSRDVLLGTLWLDLVGRFQAGWIEALEQGDAEAAALHTPAWVREHPTEARLLLLHRREDFLAGDWPPRLAERAAHVNDRAGAVLRAFTRAELGDDLPASVRRVRFALVEIPYAAVRPYVEAGQPPPPDVDALVLTASQAVLDDEASSSVPMITNVHQRTLPVPVDEAGFLIDDLAGPDDRLWPYDRWPAIRFDHPLQVGAKGGHGPFRYKVGAYAPGRRVQFVFGEPERRGLPRVRAARGRRDALRAAPHADGPPVGAVQRSCGRCSSARCTTRACATSSTAPRRRPAGTAGAAPTRPPFARGGCCSGH